MKTFLITIGIAILYLLLTVMTMILSMYIDRMDGFDEDYVYSKYREYIEISLLSPVTLPIVLGILFYRKIKVLVISIVELMVLNKEKKNNK
jgi:hypothetical protein